MSAAIAEPPVTSPAAAPVAVPGAAKVAMLISLLLVAAGAVLVREALVAAGLISGKAWLAGALDGLDGLQPATWMVPVGAAVALLGAALVLISLVPRRRTELTLRPAGVAFVRPRDLTRIVRAAAGEVDGVLSTTTSASRRRVRVAVTSLRDPETVRAQVESIVRVALEPVRPGPAVIVVARTAKESS